MCVFVLVFRDEAQTKMRALKERAERDSQQYSHELKKLQRALDHQNHLRAFVATISAGEEDETAQRRPEGVCVGESQSVWLVVNRFRVWVSDVSIEWVSLEMGLGYHVVNIW